jgi:predicted metal-dependent peptidase
MALCGYVEQHKTMQKIVFFTWGKGEFHYVFGDMPTKWPIAKSKSFLCFGTHHN